MLRLFYARPPAWRFSAMPAASIESPPATSLIEALMNKLFKQLGIDLDRAPA